MDKLLGAYVGGILGDALGAPHELSKRIPYDNYTGKLQYPVPIYNRYIQVLRNGKVGQVTDDSLMENVILRHIHTNKTLVRDKLIVEYCYFANQYPWTLGYNTRALFHGVKTVKGYESRVEKTDLTNQQSNGSLMRANGLYHLLLFMSPEQAYQVAVSDTCLTNPHVVNQDCTIVYLYMLQLASVGYNPVDGLMKLFDIAQTKEVKQRIVSTLKGKVFDINGKDDGWVVHGLGCAMEAWLLSKTKTYAEIMYSILHKRGDTDTNMKIAGSVLGMCLGYKELYNQQKENIDLMTESDYTDGELPLKPEDHPKYMIDFLRKQLHNVDV